MNFPTTTHSACSGDPLSMGFGNTQELPQQAQPQLAILDLFFPGFSVFSAAIQRYLGIDLNIYIPLLLMGGALTFCWNYVSEYLWGVVETHMMSTVEIRTDDEIYNIIMSWVAAQRFSQGARRFVVNTNLKSRSWFVWRWEDDEEEEGEDGETSPDPEKQQKALAYTPSFGSHTFWYRGRLLLFKRSANQQQNSFMMVSEREEISMSCFGRNPWILKELLLEARQAYMKKDEAKTLIYRGTVKLDAGGPSWQRCMSRTSRPLSTVILNEKTKKDLIDDISDYLNPATRRWYSNRGIPYRRGYLLYGPPGTGKSSLSLAVAGLFKMRIYIVSLSSGMANEESLGTLFAELPRRCVVLLEDIDTAGLTHTRDDASKATSSASSMVPGQVTQGTEQKGTLSLSGLLNILDGVASQEGRVLIMTTNHLEKLDKALIRPGRVDMIVKFDKADNEICVSIFRAIYATLEGDSRSPTEKEAALAELQPLSPEDEKKSIEEATKKREAEEAHIATLAEVFASKIPAHEFSPAEIQGFLLKNKRDPEAAVSGAENWVVETRKEKAEKELREAKEKRLAEQKAKEEEEEKKEKEKKGSKSKREQKRSKKSKKDDASDSSGSDSSSDSDSESGSPSDSETKSKSKPKPMPNPDSKVSLASQVEKTNKEDSKGEEVADLPKGHLSSLPVVSEPCEGDSGYGSSS